MDRVWSAQQEAIFGWFGSAGGNLVVRARAGTGKTTTILEGIGRAPEGKILLCAFNKRIAEELQTKVRNPAAEGEDAPRGGVLVHPPELDGRPHRR